MCAAIEDVVVLPCAPATAIVRFSALRSASRPRAGGRAARARGAAARSGFSGAIALEWTTSTSSPAGTFAAAWPTCTSTPSARSSARPGNPRGRSPTPSRRADRGAGVAAHPGAAEPDEVQPPPGPRPVAHAPTIGRRRVEANTRRNLRCARARAHRRAGPSPPAGIALPTASLVSARYSGRGGRARRVPQRRLRPLFASTTPRTDGGRVSDQPWAGRRLHLIGLGGAGMSGYARVATRLGARVSGSDRGGGPGPRGGCARSASRSTSGTTPRSPGRRGRRGSTPPRSRPTTPNARRPRARAAYRPRADLLEQISRAEADDRGRGRAREDDDDVDDRPRAAAHRAWSPRT